MCDASALVEYLLRTPFGLEVASIIEDPEAELHIPALCDVEVAGVLGRLAYDEALRTYFDLPLWRHGHRLLAARIAELAGRLSAYDAAYVALCERLDAALVTGDPDLTSAARDHFTLNVIGVTAAT